MARRARRLVRRARLHGPGRRRTPRPVLARPRHGIRRRPSRCQRASARGPAVSGRDPDAPATVLAGRVPAARLRRRVRARTRRNAAVYLVNRRARVLASSAVRGIAADDGNSSARHRAARAAAAPVSRGPGPHAGERVLRSLRRSRGPCHGFTNLHAGGIQGISGYWDVCGAVRWPRQRSSHALEWRRPTRADCRRRRPATWSFPWLVRHTSQRMLSTTKCCQSRRRWTSASCSRCATRPHSTHS